MKIVVAILIVLLLAVSGAAAFFYLKVHTPLATDYARIKAAMPELDKSARELKRYKDKEAWIKPALETWKSGLSDELNAGSAEVAATTDGTLVIAVKEQALYTTGVVTFAKDSPPLLTKIASLIKTMKDLKDKEVVIANTTAPGAPQGQGRRKIPGKTARDLAADRSLALIKYLEKNGVASEALVAAAYPEKLPERGFGIPERKTMIIIGHPAAAATAAVPGAPRQPAAAPAAAAKPAENPAAKALAPAPTAPPAAAPKPIPIQPQQSPQGQQGVQ